MDLCTRTPIVRVDDVSQTQGIEYIAAVRGADMDGGEVAG